MGWIDKAMGRVLVPRQLSRRFLWRSRLPPLVVVLWNVRDELRKTTLDVFVLFQVKSLSHTEMRLDDLAVSACSFVQIAQNQDRTAVGPLALKSH